LTRFAVLGPLTVRQDGYEVRVTAPKARLLLATLLLHAGEVISAGKLVDVLWNDEPPPTARTALQNHVMRLRRALGADLGQRIRSHPSGYSIMVRDGELDLHRFGQQYDQGMAAVRQGAWERAADELRMALAEWAGEPLADLRGSALDGAELPWLAELRLQALEHRIVADHWLGRHDATIAELRYLCGAHPLRERLRELLMIALLRRGGHAEALEVYSSTRALLVAELGVEPGPAIQRLRDRLVVADQAPVIRPAPHPRAAVCQLPADISDFTGRASARDRLSRVLAGGQPRTGGVPVALICGPPGSGKTALALNAAHLIRSSFPDGQLFVELAGATTKPREPGDVLGEWLRAFGLSPEEIPERPEDRAALYRSRLADRAVLVVLDDASSAASVRPLLPGTAGCAVIVTSRSRLTTLPGVDLIQVDSLSRLDSVRLLSRIVGDARVSAEPTAAQTLVRACGRLPRAIRIAGARLAARPSWPIADFTELVCDERRRLDELAVDDLAIRASVAASVPVPRPLRPSNSGSPASSPAGREPA